MPKVHLGCLLAVCCALLANCATLAPRAVHPYDEPLEGQWFYDCRYFMVADDLPVSVSGYAIYFEGRTHERLDVSAGTDCSEAGRILTMRFHGTYALGGTVQVRLGDSTVTGVRDEEVKEQVTYELTPTFASVVGDDADCKSLVGQKRIDGSVPALATCSVTKDFRELEDRVRDDHTVLYIDHCRLISGDEESEKDGDGYPTVLDTKTWGVKYCPGDTDKE